jgi:serine/threonine protein kinase
MRHPNIVTFMGAAYKGTDLYIVTEYVSKGALRGLLKNPEVHLSWQVRGRLALDVACASTLSLHRGCDSSRTSWRPH